MLYKSILAAGALAAAAVASPVPEQAATGDPPGDFQQNMLAGHDWYRHQHSAGNMTWSDDVAQSAQSWANNCQFQHSKGSGNGENLVGGSLATWAQGINLWGSERTKYDYNNPGFSSATGHFTQMVWKGSTKLGCGWKKCGGNLPVFIVCQYSPAGNIIGGTRFKDNVGRQVEGKPTDTWNP